MQPDTFGNMMKFCTEQASLNFNEFQPRTAPPSMLPVYDFHINLNNGKLSVKGTQKPKYGKLICHSETAIIYEATCRVQQGSYERAVREGVRNVHAFVRGYSELDTDISGYLTRKDLIRVRYNPFVCNFFFRVDSNQPVARADIVILDHHTMYAINPR